MKLSCGFLWGPPLSARRHPQESGRHKELVTDSPQPHGRVSAQLPAIPGALPRIVRSGGFACSLSFPPGDSLTGRCRGPRSRAPSFPAAGSLARSLHRHASGGQRVAGAFTKRLTGTSGPGVSLNTGLPSAAATGPGELRYS